MFAVIAVCSTWCVFVCPGVAIPSVSIKAHSMYMQRPFTETPFCGVFLSLVFSLFVKILVKTPHLLLRGYHLLRFSMVTFPICPFLHLNYFTDFGFLLKLMRTQDITQTVMRVCFTQNCSVSTDRICRLVV